MQLSGNERRKEWVRKCELDTEEGRDCSRQKYCQLESESLREK